MRPHLGSQAAHVPDVHHPQWHAPPTPTRLGTCHGPLYRGRWRSRPVTFGVGGAGDSLRRWRDPRPGRRHRHTVLTVTTRSQPGGKTRQRGHFGSRGAPTCTRSRPPPENAPPNCTRSPLRPGRLVGHPSPLPQKPAAATRRTPPRAAVSTPASRRLTTAAPRISNEFSRPARRAAHRFPRSGGRSRRASCSRSVIRGTGRRRRRPRREWRCGSMTYPASCWPAAAWSRWSPRAMSSG